MAAVAQNTKLKTNVDAAVNPSAGLSIKAANLANKSKFGLCGAVFSCDIKEAMDVASRLECGGAVINGASFYRSAEMPFGGWKYSGIGNEGISTTLQEMSHIKTIVLKNVLK